MNIVIELGVKSSPEKIIYKGRSNFSKSYNYFSMKTFTVGCTRRISQNFAQSKCEQISKFYKSVTGMKCEEGKGTNQIYYSTPLYFCNLTLYVHMFFSHSDLKCKPWHQ